MRLTERGLRHVPLRATRARLRRGKEPHPGAPVGSGSGSTGRLCHGAGRAETVSPDRVGCGQLRCAARVRAHSRGVQGQRRPGRSQLPRRPRPTGPETDRDDLAARRGGRQAPPAPQTGGSGNLPFAGLAFPGHPGEQHERQAAQSAAQSPGLTAERFEVSSSADFDQALEAIRHGSLDALVRFPTASAGRPGRDRGARLRAAPSKRVRLAGVRRGGQAAAPGPTLKVPGAASSSTWTSS
jgi:hypothetical protein